MNRQTDKQTDRQTDIYWPTDRYREQTKKTEEQRGVSKATQSWKRRRSETCEATRGCLHRFLFWLRARGKKASQSSSSSSSSSSFCRGIMSEKYRTRSGARLVVDGGTYDAPRWRRLICHLPKTWDDEKRWWEKNGDGNDRRDDNHHHDDDDEDNDDVLRWIRWCETTMTMYADSRRCRRGIASSKSLRFIHNCRQYLIVQ